MPVPNWTVIVPVKRLALAKSRLRGAVPGIPHESLALALARDTVAAVSASPAVARVVVVTTDATAATALATLGAWIVDDPPGGGLNQAFRAGAAYAEGWVAALTADLPALRPDELTAALRQAAAAADSPARAAQRLTAGTRRFVADTPGTGTVLLTAASGAALDPRFGAGSAAAHAASGARRLCGRWPTLRRDVDTPADLLAASRLGLGTHTATLLRRAGWDGAEVYGAGHAGHRGDLRPAAPQRHTAAR